LISQGKSLGFKASDERSVSFEIEAVKNQRQLIIKKQDKQLEPPVMSSEVSPHVVNTNRSDHEEEKENTQNHIEVSNVDDIQIVEIRHCMICKIDQPIRTKHCRDCGRCVATQDHHCPWLGVCIGEKNKKSFYFYLVIQMIQLLWTFLLVMIKKDLKSIDNPGSVFRWFLVNWLNLSLAVLLAIFIVMVGGLIGFHLYLASINLTTWEFLSWNKISYLKGLDKQLGSPFSNGIVSNLYNNCCRRIPKYFIVWEVTRGK
jgi:palmitoyltransferase